LAHWNEWMWSWEPPNYVRLDLNEMCSPSLPTSGGS
jgi:hypothetical protein